MIEEEQNRKKRLWLRDWVGRRDSRGASTLFYNLHYSCSTNIRSRDKARRIYKCRPQSTSFSFCMKKSAAGFIKTRYATIFHQQQSWTDLCCYATCPCTAMVYTGRADSLVHGRVKKLRVGEGEWASYYPFRSTTRLYSQSPVTWLFTWPNCLHWSSYTCFFVLASLTLTRLM